MKCRDSQVRLTEQRGGERYERKQLQTEHASITGEMILRKRQIFGQKVPHKILKQWKQNLWGGGGGRKQLSLTGIMSLLWERLIKVRVCWNETVERLL